MSLRLLTGELGGRRLDVPAGVRPTESRVREALISIWRPRLPGARFLDLFAGSGAVGLEALSQGAAHVCFVEQSPRVLQALRRTCAALAPEAVSPIRILRGRLPGVLAGPRRPEGFDLIFADPPYDFAKYEALVEAAGGCAKDDGEIAVEHSERREIAAEIAGWRRFDRRRYGESCVSFYERLPPA